jgi:hypothetical protein
VPQYTPTLLIATKHTLLQRCNILLIAFLCYNGLGWARPKLWVSAEGHGEIPSEFPQVCPGFLIVPGKGRIRKTPDWDGQCYV